MKPENPKKSEASQHAGCKCRFCTADVWDGDMGADYMIAEHAEWYDETFNDLK